MYVGILAAELHMPPLGRPMHEGCNLPSTPVNAAVCHFWGLQRCVASG